MTTPPVTDTAPAVRWETQPDGIVHLVLDDPAAPVNTLNDAYASAMDAALDRIEAERDTLAGVVLTSAKSSFFAGGDLNRLLAITPEQEADFVADVDVRKHRLHRLENSGVPVVAVLDGAAMGGGLELALACHRRIAVRSRRLLIGLPETSLGLAPGAGGIVRASLMIGARALDLIMDGTRLGADEALDVGLLDEVVDDLDTALDAAHAWLAATPRPARQRWQQQPTDLDVLEVALRPVTALPATAVPTRQQVARVALAAAAGARTGDVSAAMHDESALLGALVVSDAAKDTIGVNFLDTAALRRAAKQAVTASGAEAPHIVAEDAVSAAALKGHRFVSAPADSDRPTVTVASRRELAHGQARLSPDPVGDGLVALEVAIDPRAHDADALRSSLPALVRLGAQPVEVLPGTAPSAMLSALRQRRIEQLGTLGHAARAWTTNDSSALDVSTREAELPDGTQDAAAQLLDELATAVLDLAEIHPGLAAHTDLASVRLGILPAWTGGARRRLSRTSISARTHQGAHP